MNCTYMKHWRAGEPACPACKARQAEYSRRWRRDGPTPRHGLPELVVDVVESNEPVTVTELPTLIPGAKPESVRRTVYRLLDEKRLRRVNGDVFTIGAA